MGEIINSKNLKKELKGLAFYLLNERDLSNGEMEFLLSQFLNVLSLVENIINNDLKQKLIKPMRK